MTADLGKGEDFAGGKEEEEETTRDIGRKR